MESNKGVQQCKIKAELLFRTDLIQALGKFVERHNSRKKFKSESRVRIVLNESCFLHEIFSTPLPVLIEWAKILKISLPGFDSKRDLENGSYEGGCKVWEATEDMVKFISEDMEFIGTLLNTDKKLKVLELGCGSGLVSLAFLSRLISQENFNSEYRIHVQDFNWDVLVTLTLLNFGFNLPFDYLEALIETKWLKFFFGDWSNFAGGKLKCRYNLIMTCETIYNSQNYQSLHDLFDRHLRKDGLIVIATKDNYFGLSGGLYLWLDYIAEKNIFTPVRMLKVFQANIPRSILVLRKNSSLKN